MAATTMTLRTLLLPIFNTGIGEHVVNNFVNSLIATYGTSLHAASANDGATSLKGNSYNRITLLLTSAQDTTLVASLPALASSLGLAAITTWSESVSSGY